MKIITPRPCDSCPFRVEPYFELAPGRRAEIAQSLRDENVFHCHKQVDYDDEGGYTVGQVCAGAVKSALLSEVNNWMHRLAMATDDLLIDEVLATGAEVWPLDSWTEIGEGAT